MSFSVNSLINNIIGIIIGAVIGVIIANNTFDENKEQTYININKNKTYEPRVQGTSALFQSVA